MKSSKFLQRFRALATAGAVAASLAFSGSALAAASITLVNFDGPGEGLNDPTPVAPVGGNTGTTLGQQRAIALLHAAGIWANTLTSNVTITIRVAFNALTCNATGAVLASAGTRLVSRDFAGAPLAGTWYHASLANKLAGADQFGGQDQINSQFNSNLGAANCLSGSPFYLGLDGNEGAGVDLVATATHEFGHGLGFSNFTSSATGAFFLGFPSVWDHFLSDNTTGVRWVNKNDAQRVASAINFRRLAWAGNSVTNALPSVLSLGTPRLSVSGVNAASAAGDYPVQPAAFGPALSASGVSADVMPVAAQSNDGGGNGCAPFSAANALAVSNRIALINRGVCGFALKVKNAQNAGARGVIIANNVAGGLPGMGGADPTVTIPSVGILLADGNAIRQRLAFRSRTASGVVGTLGINAGQYAGADAMGRMLMFTPDVLQPGSSVSHWDTLATRNLVMEPAINVDLLQSVLPPIDLTFPLFQDIGW